MLTSDTTCLSPITLEILPRILFSQSKNHSLPEVSFVVSFMKSNYIIVNFNPAFYVYPGAEYEYSGLLLFMRVDISTNSQRHQLMEEQPLLNKTVNSCPFFIINFLIISCVRLITSSAGVSCFSDDQKLSFVRLSGSWKLLKVK